MQNFELLRNVTIGQYIPTGSAVHRLDPRAKILAATFLILGISFNLSILGNLFALVVVLIIARLALIPFSYVLRGFLLGLPVLIFILITQLLFLGTVEPAGQVYFEWGWFRITRYSLHLMVISVLRITSFIFLTSMITMTSSTTELTHGVERLLQPFRRFRVPAHELALVLTIALRFVPTLAEEMERILKAQASRGADIGSGSIWRPDKIARAYLPLIVPLFLNAFRRAEDLVLAMQARGYVSGEGRTRYIQLRSRPVDWLATLVALLIMLLLLAYRWPAVRDLLAQVGVMGL
jgi:energy-coupling factor transport system permease protein